MIDGSSGRIDIKPGQLWTENAHHRMATRVYMVLAVKPVSGWIDPDVSLECVIGLVSCPNVTGTFLTSRDLKWKFTDAWINSHMQLMCDV